MSSIDSVVIVGGSLAGAKAAEALRKDGYDGAIVLLGDERQRPYVRPPLSKDYLRGETEADAVFVHRAAWYTEHDVDLQLSTAVRAIEPGAREVILADGRRLAYDRLLLATGSSPRRLEVAGRDLGGIHYLRTLQDADAIRAAATTARRAVVVGGGWIGSEVAASLRMLGVPVSMVAPGSVPLERALGMELGTVYRDLHAEHGVRLLMNQHVAAFRGRAAVEAVETAEGARIAADLVVVGIGAEPRTELAVAAGLAVENGIAVDEYLATSEPRIFAAGDVAAAWHPLLKARLRVEHWDNARRQGTAAAHNMLGQAHPYDRLPYFYSDQYDLSIEYTGHAWTWEQVVFRGEPAERAFIAFWLVDGRVVAGLSANVWQVSDAIAALIESRRRVNLRNLVDPAIPLADLEALVMPETVAVGAV